MRATLRTHSHTLSLVEQVTLTAALFVCQVVDSERSPSEEAERVARPEERNHGGVSLIDSPLPPVVAHSTADTTLTLPVSIYRSHTHTQVSDGLSFY